MSSDLEKKLIDSIYDVTIDPQKYDKLLLLWENEFLRSSLDAPINYNGDDSQALQNRNSIIEDHVQRAHKILELTNPLSDFEPTIKQLIDADPLPTFIISADKIVTLANDAALNFFGIGLGMKLPNNIFETKSVLKINNYLKQLDEVKPNRILSIIQPEDEEGETSYLFALSKIYDDELKCNFLQISVVSTVWNEDVGKTIQDSFGLSDTELDLAKRYVAGERMADIAAVKSRSINTVKTQSKTLFRKTKLKSQSELIRLFSALQQFGQQENDYILNHSAQAEATHLVSSQNKSLDRDGGRKLYYEIYGDPNGEPVLFMHDIIIGTKLSQKIVGHLFTQKIKLIAPHRAGFGKSDTYLKKDTMAAFVKDMQAVLDAENVGKFKIMSQFAGSVYAFKLAEQMPEHILKMRLINSHVPITSKAQLAKIPMPNKVLVYISVYMPQLLPFFMRIMAVQIKRYGANYVMEQYFKDSELDLELLKQPEIAKIIADSFHHCFDSGVNGPSQTAKDAIQYDWSHLVENCKLPVEYFHTKNNVVPLKKIRNLVDLYDHLTIKIFDGGQLILYDHPEKMLNNL